MRIVIDARESGTSTGRYVDKLIEYLQKNDTKNEYFLLLKSGRMGSYPNLVSNFHAVRCDVKEFTFAEQTKLLWQIIRLRPNLVHFPLVQHPVLYFGKSVVGMLDLTTLRFKNPSKNPLIFWLKQRVYWLVNYIASRKAKKIIAISQFVKDDLVRHFKIKPEKIVITYNAADKIEEDPEPISYLENKRFLMYVGRHLPHKNLERLIEAHQKLLKDSPELFLAVIGKKDATTEILEKKILDKGFRNVIFTGFVDDGQLRWLYENTSCYVFPSLSEGFGLPGLEAMVHGAPVASSNATCLPEIYGDGALYFDPSNIDDMADKISQIISDKKLRDNLISKGYKQAKKYSWKRMAEQTLEVYNLALKNV